jgi:hypothetical protein
VAYCSTYIAASIQLSNNNLLKNPGYQAKSSKIPEKSMSGHSSHDMSRSNHEDDAPSVIAPNISAFISA